MDFAETREQLLLRETVRRIASGFGESYFREQARSGGKTTELWDALAAEGFLGACRPEEYGGGGLGITELAIVCEETAAAGCPLLLLVVTPSISGTIIARFGNEEQKRRWLPGLASGREKIVFALTEPEAGAMLVVARTGTDERTGRGLLSLFVVPTEAPGLERQLIEVALVTPERQFTLFFGDVAVPADNLIGEKDNGLPQLFFGLNPERITGAAFAVGAGLLALEKACRYANEREVWGVPIGAHQGLAHPLAKCKIELELAKLMTYKAAWLYDEGYDAGQATNMANYAAAEASLACIDEAIQVHGGPGLSEEIGLTDMWWATRLGRTAPVSREMILNYIAQASLGLPR